MRILIVSDTHGQLDPRIADLSLTCEYALHAGDIGHPAVLGTLQPSREVLAVRGNNDVPRKWRPRERQS